MANRLINESSLYLRQHAENPVDWWPWCEEAFTKAKEEDKLVLVSIGYSSCHWCHVMAHESFEDEYIANIMNRHFVCIKVDREERPDIDQMFVEVVQMITGRAGWPLNVFCLPDGRPFFGGTYFPPKDIGRGMIPWPQLLMRIVEHYKKAPQELAENAENIIQNLELSNNPLVDEGLKMSDFLEAAKAICKTHDDEWGGFGQAPKFPSPTVLDFLFSIREVKIEGADNEVFMKEVDKVLITTLKGMGHGGIFDQLGGGFSRYSVDRFWAIPHFEKMLYDNGLLLSMYTKGYLLSGLELFKSVVEETVGWLVREMMTKEGAFAASLDADTEGVEGKYYAWTQDEVIKSLGEEKGQLFCEAYNITREGNFEEGSSIPAWVYDNDQKRTELEPLREKLLAVREMRKKPGKDSKVLVAWNALLINGLVDAGFYFNRPEWVKLGRKALDWIWQKLFDEKSGRLKSVYYEEGKDGKEGKVVSGYLDDYAFYAQGCLNLASKIDWIESGLSETYIKRAEKVIAIVMESFRDTQDNGFFFTANGHEKLITRKKYWWDQAIPSGNASLVHCFSELYALTGEGCYAQRLQELRRSYSLFAKNAPNGVAYALSGFVQDDVGIAVLKMSEESVEKMGSIQDYLSKRLYRKVFLLVDKKLKRKEYQLCLGSQCLEVTDNLELILSQV